MEAEYVKKGQKRKTEKKGRTSQTKSEKIKTDQAKIRLVRNTQRSENQQGKHNADNHRHI